MARVAILDVFQEFAQLPAIPLLEGGHEVLIELVPIDFERVLGFSPDLVIAALYRMNKAYDRPIGRAEHDILGYIPLQSLQGYPSGDMIPLVLLGYGLHERDIPRECCHYDLFLSLPKDIRLLPPKIEELLKKVKRRRKISTYLCPHCRSRLTYTAWRPDDLFCPRCGTSVALIDEENCIYSPPGWQGTGRPCQIKDLLLAPGRREDPPESSPPDQASKPNEAE